ncbi:MAG TPA: glycosyltransferase [Ignavibacteriaceae bacterium]|nr:glycosyltransferase [Ignavibacteriaceae bacterium]
MADATVIASFYNKIDYLKLVLAGFERQTNKNFEVIIADDGSTEDIVKEIESTSKNYAFNIKHIWQEDRGFRKNRILNQAILASNSDYLIFIDADCIPHSHFVEEHVNNRLNEVCLTGRRVNLSEKITTQLTEEKIKEGFPGYRTSLLIKDGLFGKSYDVEKGFYFKSIFLRELFNSKQRGLLGCNFSIHKNEIIKINGFDERYEAPSIGEDSDVQFRLELIGIKIKSLNNIAVQYHLYHKMQKRPQKNLDLFEEVKKSRLAFTPYGIK